MALLISGFGDQPRQLLLLLEPLADGGLPPLPKRRRDSERRGEPRLALAFGGAGPAPVGFLCEFIKQLSQVCRSGGRGDLQSRIVGERRGDGCGSGKTEIVSGDAFLQGSAA